MDEREFIVGLPYLTKNREYSVNLVRNNITKVMTASTHDQAIYLTDLAELLYEVKIDFSK